MSSPWGLQLVGKVARPNAFVIFVSTKRFGFVNFTRLPPKITRPSLFQAESFSDHLKSDAVLPMLKA